MSLFIQKSETLLPFYLPQVALAHLGAILLFCRFGCPQHHPRLQLVLLMAPLRLNSSPGISAELGMSLCSPTGQWQQTQLPGLGACRLQRGLWLLLLQLAGTKQLLRECWALELLSEKKSVGWERGWFWDMSEAVALGSSRQ